MDRMLASASGKPLASDARVSGFGGWHGRAAARAAMDQRSVREEHSRQPPREE